MESGQTDQVSQQVESYATPRTLDSSVSFEFAPEVTQDRDHATDEDTEYVENQGPKMGQI